MRQCKGTAEWLDKTGHKIAERLRIRGGHNNLTGLATQGHIRLRKCRRISAVDRNLK